MVLALVAVAAAVSSCATVGSYPAELHQVRDAVHVCCRASTTQVALPDGAELTVLDAVLNHSSGPRDFSLVTVHRRDGDHAQRIYVNVHAMIKNGRQDQNILLQSGDVVVIPD